MQGFLNASLEIDLYFWILFVIQFLLQDVKEPATVLLPNSTISALLSVVLLVHGVYICRSSKWLTLFNTHLHFPIILSHHLPQKIQGTGPKLLSRTRLYTTKKTFEHSQSNEFSSAKQPSFL